MVADVVAAVLLAAVFTLAGVAKLRSPTPFRATLSELLPRALIRPAAVLVPALELAVAASLLGWTGVGWVPAAAIVMLAAFSAALAVLIRRGVDDDCGCFGNRRHGNQRAGLMRNAALIVVALPLLDAGEPVLLADADVLVSGAVVAAGLVVAWTLAAAVMAERSVVFPRTSAREAHR